MDPHENYEDVSQYLFLVIQRIISSEHVFLHNWGGGVFDDRKYKFGKTKVEK